jgi:hypothetical protein
MRSARGGSSSVKERHCDSDAQAGGDQSVLSCERSSVAALRPPMEASGLKLSIAVEMSMLT